LQTSGTASQKAAFAKLCVYPASSASYTLDIYLDTPNADGTQRSVMKSVAGANTLRAETVLKRLKGELPLSDSASATDTASDADDDQDAARKRPKITKNGSGDGSSGASCGSNSGKGSKVTV
jgi:hypothetical protein